MSDKVDFGSTKLMGFLGLIAGVLIAVAVPWMVVRNTGPGGFGSLASTVICIVAISGGTGLAIISVFFSIVIPRKVEDSD